MKDHFSKVSQLYSQCRPIYSKEVFEYIASLPSGNENAWDCATGNGQVARGLAPFFKRVMATDISKQQIQHAFKAENIFYSISAAEHTSFPDNYFDVISVGQAIHWFNFFSFYEEAKRVAKNKALLVVLGYDLMRVDDSTDFVVAKLYNEILNGFWDAERKYLDEHYRTIPFPFSELKAPQFQLTFQWSAQELLGYLETWSAVQHFEKKHHHTPLDLIRDEVLKTFVGTPKKEVKFPILLRIGMIEK